MIKGFRLIGYLEGISYLLLIGIGVPLKYFADNPSWVKSLGMPHGLLFVAYVFAAVILREKLSWDKKTFFIILVAAIIPFGTFYVDNKYFK